MDVLVICLQQNEVPLAFFRFGASIHALSVLEQLDFKEDTIVFPDGSVMTPEQIAQIKEDGITIPRAVTVDTKTLLQVLAMMDPYTSPQADPSLGMSDIIARQQANERGQLFHLQRSVIEGAVKALDGHQGISVSMSLQPVNNEMHSPEDNGYSPDDEERGF